MTILTSKDRNDLPSHVFGLPKERKYPMPDKAHAIDAKDRATEEYHKGHITKAQRDEIFAHADRVIAAHNRHETARVLYDKK
ncbi:MAG TPA: hypothetical protein VFN69_04315 [Rudaea sp.]|nr:hypothetical protein [Rudaea sp.]